MSILLEQVPRASKESAHAPPLTEVAPESPIEVDAESLNLFRELALRLARAEAALTSAGKMTEGSRAIIERLRGEGSAFFRSAGDADGDALHRFTKDVIDFEDAVAMRVDPEELRVDGKEQQERDRAVIELLKEADDTDAVTALSRELDARQYASRLRPLILEEDMLALRQKKSDLQERLDSASTTLTDIRDAVEAVCRATERIVETPRGSITVHEDAESIARVRDSLQSMAETAHTLFEKMRERVSEGARASENEEIQSILESLRRSADALEIKLAFIQRLQATVDGYLRI